MTQRSRASAPLIRVLGAMAWVFGVLLVPPLGAQEGGPMPIQVHQDRTHQTVEHFGASAAWWAQYVGKWAPDVQGQALDWLFDRDKGIGLTLVRYNLGGGKAEAIVTDPWRSAFSPYQTDGSLDWSKDRVAMNVIDGAVRRGARVLVFANSPPAALTITGAPTGNKDKTNLAADQRAAFAAYLVRVTEQLARRWPLVAVSPINEPQWDWQPSKGQEGSFYSPTDARDTLKAVVQAFREHKITVPISAIDSGEWSLAKNIRYLEAMFDDPELRAALKHYAVHSYWSVDEDREDLARYLAKEVPGLGLWMTEWTEMRGEKDVGMTAGLALAHTVHGDLAIAHAQSWQYWIAISKYNYADGLLYADDRRETVEATKKLWVLGQWSRFVRPGAVNVEVEVDPASGLRISGFRNQDGSTVLVAINSGTDPVGPLPLTGTAGKIEGWRTSPTEDLRPLGVLAPAALTFAPQSVTTLVISGR